MPAAHIEEKYCGPRTQKIVDATDLGIQFHKCQRKQTNLLALISSEVFVAALPAPVDSRILINLPYSS